MVIASSFTRYGDMKHVENAKNGVVGVVGGHPRSSANRQCGNATIR